MKKGRKGVGSEGRADKKKTICNMIMRRGWLMVEHKQTLIDSCHVFITLAHPEPRLHYRHKKRPPSFSQSKRDDGTGLFCLIIILKCAINYTYKPGMGEEAASHGFNNFAVRDEAGDGRRLTYHHRGGLPGGLLQVS